MTTTYKTKIVSFISYKPIIDNYKRLLKIFSGKTCLYNFNKLISKKKEVYFILFQEISISSILKIL